MELLGRKLTYQTTSFEFSFRPTDKRFKFWSELAFVSRTYLPYFSNPHSQEHVAQTLWIEPSQEEGGR